jgi:glycosyltransferase involved in cell wall biosynthesis
LSPVAFCIPGDIGLPTGGYRYDREVLARLPQWGVPCAHIRLDGGFPFPSSAALAETELMLQAISERTLLLIDGLALGAMPPAMIDRLPHRVVALVHHPLGLETGLDPDRAKAMLSNEKAVLARMRHVIVTSDSTKRYLMAEFALKERAITVAEPGTARAERSSGTGDPIRILAVGTISPRKAYNILIEALAPLAMLDWHLTIAGSLTLVPDAADALVEAINRNGLSHRVTLAGVMSDKDLSALYAKADLFAMASLFEGYGMALTEALAHGLPIVSSAGGAAAETLPDAAALKVPAGDVAALSEALERVITDKALRRRMADASWAAAALLPTWDDTAREIADVLKSI